MFQDPIRKSWLSGGCGMAAAVILMTCLGASASAEVKLPAVFGSHMVLQREKPVIVWGWANPGEAVAVTLDSQQQHTQATAAGEWRVTFPALKGGGPLTMTIKGTNTLTLDDILVGEVWLCSGQSNMEMGVGMAANHAQEAAAANHPGIRLFLIPKTLAATPQRDVQATWKVCSPTTVLEGGWGGFSAAAYYFGRDLHQKLNVPVGLIESAWGGTMIEPWTPPEAFAANPALKTIDEGVRLADPQAPVHKERLSRLLSDTEAWTTAARKALNEQGAVPPMPIFPEELNFRITAGTPTAIYNAMIHPLVPFGIRGAIWYQGESNHGDGMLYTEKTKALVSGWRNLWKNPELSFYYTQIAPYNYGDKDPATVPLFWEAQAAAMAIPNTGMAGTTDIGNVSDIHPANKQEVGRRLALWALAQTYGQPVLCSGPTFKSFKAEGNTIRVAFDNVGGGLVSRDGKPLNWFEIVDADTGGFVKADAAIEGDTVVLSAKEVSHPAALRFGWNKVAEPNLSNKDGLPAFPFRAGEVPKHDCLSLIPEAKDFKLVYDLDLGKLGPSFGYDVDQHAALAGAIDRVAYFMELQGDNGESRYAYVSMNAFTQSLAKIGVPTIASGAFFQTTVSAMNVYSNVQGIVTGTGLSGGNIEFWPWNYAPDNAAQVPNASSQAYDFGDHPTQGTGNYGSMQIHNNAAKQTILALNHWDAGDRADLGIGNQPTGQPDWTFAENAGKISVKRLRVLVHFK